MVEVDPDKYDISENKLVINADDHLVLVAAALNTSIEYTNVPLPVNKIALDAQETYSVLIKWDLSDDVSGDIMYMHGCKITYIWGNLTNPPNFDYYDCLGNNPYIPTLAEPDHRIDPIFNTKGDTQDLVRITVCSSSNNSRVNINIRERLPIPEKNLNTIIYASQKKLQYLKLKNTSYILTLVI